MQVGGRTRSRSSRRLGRAHPTCPPPPSLPLATTTDTSCTSPILASHLLVSRHQSIPPFLVRTLWSLTLPIALSIVVVRARPCALNAPPSPLAFAFADRPSSCVRSGTNGRHQDVKGALQLHTSPHGRCRRTAPWLRPDELGGADRLPVPPSLACVHLLCPALQVDGVIMDKLGVRSEGVLHLTLHHMIFAPDGQQEIWVSPSPSSRTYSSSSPVPRPWPAAAAARVRSALKLTARAAGRTRLMIRPRGG